MRAIRWSTALLASTVLTAWIVILGVMPAPPDRDAPSRERGRANPSSPTRTAPNDAAESAGSPANPPGRAISGRVLWPDGEGLESSSISLLDPGGESRATLDSPDGRFTFAEVRGREFDLVATVAWHRHRGHGELGGSAEIGRWTVRAGDEGLELRVPADPDRPLLDVRVVGPAGRPVRNGRLIVDLVGKFVAGSREIVVRNGSARCLLQGPARRVVLTVWNANDADGKPLGRRAVGPLPVASTPIRIRLPRGRALRGRVVDDAGKGVALVRVEGYHPPPLFDFRGGWRLSDCLCGWSLTDEEGRFEVTHLGPGPVKLAIRPLGSCPVADRPMEATEDDVRIVLRGAVHPQITLLDPDGRIVPTGRVMVRRWSGPRVSRWTGYRIVEEDSVKDGLARPGPLDPDSRYQLLVTSPGHRRRTIPEWTPAATTVPLERVVPREPRRAACEPSPDLASETTSSGAAQLRLNIDHGMTMPLKHVDAELVPEDGGSPREIMLSLPEATIDGLDAGRSYTLRIIGVGPGLALEARGLRTASDVVDLAMEEGLSVVGRIELPAGVAGISVAARRGELSTRCEHNHVIRRDGRFEIFGLLPGTWETEVLVLARGRLYRRIVRLEAGGPETRVTVEPLL